MVETMVPTRARPHGAGRPGARPAAAVARALHEHPRLSNSQSVGIRAGLARLAAAIAALVKSLPPPMLSLVIANIVAFCTRYVWPIILGATVLASGCGYYAARHFVINADVTQLISNDLPWRQREHAYRQVFTQGTQLIAA